MKLFRKGTTHANGFTRCLLASLLSVVAVVSPSAPAQVGTPACVTCSRQSVEFDTLSGPTVQKFLKINSAVRTPVCHLLPISDPSLSKEDQGEPVLWAQYEIGADLAQEALKEMGFIPPARIGLIDMGFKLKGLTGQTSFSAVSIPFPEAEHGTLAANLINGKITGVSPMSQVVSLATLSEDDRSLDHLISIRPQVINVSMSLANSDLDRYLPRFHRLSQKSVLIFSAGNNFPTPIQPLKVRSGALIVGAMGKNGLVDNYSCDGPEVDILAPGDGAMSEDGSALKGFSNTSASAPLVSGALANAASLLPDLNTEEARKLVVATAAPTAYSTGTVRRNGAGMINAYKLVEVAKRLKRLGWPTEREKLLRSPTLFNFSAEAAKLYNDAVKNLKEDCASRIIGFQKARKAFFLDPSEKNAALVDQFYEQGNYGDGREYFQLQSADKLRKYLERSLPQSIGSSAEFPLLRAVESLGVSQLAYVKKWTASKDSNLRRAGMRASLFLGPAGCAEFSHRWTLNSDSVPEEIAYVWKCGKTMSLKVANSVFGTTPELTRAGMALAIHAGEAALPLIDRSLKSADEKIRALGVFALRGRTCTQYNDGGWRIESYEPSWRLNPIVLDARLMKMKDDPSALVRSAAAALTLEWPNREIASRLFSKFSRDPSAQVRDALISSLLTRDPSLDELSPMKDALSQFLLQELPPLGEDSNRAKKWEPKELEKLRHLQEMIASKQ